MTAALCLAKARGETRADLRDDACQLSRGQRNAVIGANPDLIHLMAGAIIKIAVDFEGHGDVGRIVLAHDPHGRCDGHLDRLVRAAVSRPGGPLLVAVSGSRLRGPRRTSRRPAVDLACTRRSGSDTGERSNIGVTCALTPPKIDDAESLIRGRVIGVAGSRRWPGRSAA
jgi:hypothetical protein